MIKLRADQWLMLGVVGIGVTAVYLLKQSKPTPREQPLYGGDGPAPGAPMLQQNILKPGPPGQPSTALLKRGTNVLGRLELGGPNATDRAGDEATAIHNLQLAGFTNIQLFTYADTQADRSLIPLRDALAYPNPNSRWFFATWNGNGTVTSGSIVMPREVELLWYTTTKPAPRQTFATA